MARVLTISLSVTIPKSFLFFITTPAPAFAFCSFFDALIRLSSGLKISLSILIFLISVYEYNQLFFQLDQKH